MVMYILFYLVAINAFTIAAFAHDKRMSMYGGWRIPEKTLFIMALLGGSPGAFYAARKFRHKTKKRSFRFVMALIIFVQIFALAFYFSGLKL